MTNIEVALQALDRGVVVKRYDGEYAAFRGDELYLVFDRGMYELCVKSHPGFLAIDDFGKTWALKPERYEDPSLLFKELNEELFGA